MADGIGLAFSALAIVAWAATRAFGWVDWLMLAVSVVWGASAVSVARRVRRTRRAETQTPVRRG